MVMKKILVPIDFSQNAYKALYFAVEIAKVAKAEILLINVCDVVDSPFRKRTELEVKHKMPLEDAILLELTIIQKNIEESMHVKASAQLYAGHVSDTIVRAAKEHHADMIIMGTLGEAAFREKLMGSVAAAVIGKAVIPVMAVPLLSEWNIPKHILILVNHFEEDPGTIADPAFQLANMFNAKVTVAIFTDEDNAVAVDYVENSTGILAYEQKLKTIYRDTVMEPERIYGHKFQETLDEYIDEHYIDILVMLTHKRNFAGNLFHKSITKKMSYHTNIPLLAIPVA
jgi:nucleotide-binding universal stress UspA family protein